MTNDKPVSWRSKRILGIGFLFFIIASIFGYDKNNNFDIVQFIYFFIIIVLLGIIAFKAYQIFKVDTSNQKKGYHNRLLGFFLIFVVIGAFFVSIVGLNVTNTNATAGSIRPTPLTIVPLPTVSQTTTSSAAWNEKGNALYGLGRYSEALDAYNKALAIDPNYKTALDNKQLVLSNDYNA